MAFGVRETESTGRHRDLDRLIDYREYQGSWSWWFEELASPDGNSSYTEQKLMRSIQPALALSHGSSANCCA
jgi:hypothetical protein